jgi:catechol 2,3-dioxygenase-like lactoylglutathione lyase family enzyme
VIHFDHVALAVHRLADAPAVLVGALGGTPAYGAPTRPYNFYQWRFANGARLEVLEPAAPDSFLHRFLAQRGPGVHHVTFTVPNLKEACARAESHGYEIVGYDDSDPEWAEAFLHPRQALGIVVQLAEVRGGSDGVPPPWPPPAAPADPPPPVAVLGLRMRATTRDRALKQWSSVLHGEVSEAGNELTFRWASSPMRLAVEITPTDPEGPIDIEYATERQSRIPDGPTPILGATFTRVR